MNIPKGIFITGTDTGVGKTYAACLLVESLKKLGLRVAVMKPVAAGVDEDGLNEDVRLLMKASNVDAPLQWVNPYCFGPLVAPHLAAQDVGEPMQMEVISHAYKKLTEISDVVVVEGAGGFLVPFDSHSGMDRIPKELKLSVIMVVGLRLGCLNHASLTEEAIRNRGMTVDGWIANRVDPEMLEQEKNLDALRSILCSPFLGDVPWKGTSLINLVAMKS